MNTLNNLLDKVRKDDLLHFVCSFALYTLLFAVLTRLATTDTAIILSAALTLLAGAGKEAADGAAMSARDFYSDLVGTGCAAAVSLIYFI